MQPNGAEGRTRGAGIVVLFVRGAEDVQNSSSQSTDTHSPIPKYVQVT